MAVSKTESRVLRTYRVDPRKVSAAQRVLGAKTPREAIEHALDSVVLGDRLIRGNARMVGIHIDTLDDDPPGP